MAIMVPPARNYAAPLISVPAEKANLPPKEGPRLIACEIDWGTMGGPNNCVNLNFQNNATLEFSQVSALCVDNSNSGADVVFIFPDTNTTCTIPSYTPYAIVEVFTNQLQFYVYASTAQPNDITRFDILNYVPPPVVVPTSQEQNFASATGIDMGTASTQLVPTSVSGTLEAAYIYLSMAATNTGGGSWALEDGNNNIIAQGAIQVSSGNKIDITLFQNTDMRVRFQNGLKMVCSQTAVLGGQISANLYYRTP